jgi:hypothetical protein
MLSEKELREHFNMPLNEVAKKYGMCTTALKKLCRKYGVMQVCVRQTLNPKPKYGVMQVCVQQTLNPKPKYGVMQVCVPQTLNPKSHNLSKSREQTLNPKP